MQRAEAGPRSGGRYLGREYLTVWDGEVAEVRVRTPELVYPYAGRLEGCHSGSEEGLSGSDGM